MLKIEQLEKKKTDFQKKRIFKAVCTVFLSLLSTHVPLEK
jgi:hypothetical protein